MDQFFIDIERPIYRFVLRLCGEEELAKDLTQESLLRAWKNRFAVREPEARRAWMYRIALNVWKDSLRRKELALSEPTQERLSSEPAPELLVMGRELGGRVWRAIGELPDRQQQVMHLRVIEQLDIGEIADVLQVDRQLVRSNLAAARKKLRECFKNELDGIHHES